MSMYMRRAINFPPPPPPAKDAPRAEWDRWHADYVAEMRRVNPQLFNPDGSLKEASIWENITLAILFLMIFGLMGGLVWLGFQL